MEKRNESVGFFLERIALSQSCLCSPVSKHASHACVLGSGGGREIGECSVDSQGETVVGPSVH